MKRTLSKETLAYVACVILAMAFWLVMLHSRMDAFASKLYLVFLHLTGSPYILWVVHAEGRESEGYFKENYGGHPGLMWAVRVFMMVVVSVMSLIAATRA